MSEYIITPVGRMVQGNLFQPNEKDYQGRQRETPQYFAALAIEKNNPEWPNFWNHIAAVAQQSFAGTNLTQSPDFAWKVIDGDDPKHSHKEGFPGHWIVKCTTGFAPQVFNSSKPPQPITDQNVAVRGHYYRFCVSVVGNDNKQKPGLFINLHMAQLVGYGEPIHGGPDAAEIFSADSGYIPQGMSTTPSAGASMPAMGGQQQPMQQPPMQQQPMQQPPMQQPPMQQQPMQQPPMQQQPMQQPAMQQPPMQPAPNGQASFADPSANSAPPAQSGGFAGMSPSNVQPHNDFLNGPGQ